MTRRLPPVPLALAAGVAFALAGSLAQAQSPAPAAPAPAPYRDRVIASDQLAPLPPDEDEAEAEALQGPPRSLRLELNASRTERANQSFEEHGLGAEGFWESATLGSFSLDAALFWRNRARTGGDELNGAATLWQRQLYFDGGWRADNGLGVLNTPAVPLLRNQPRFFLPTAPFVGASTDWTREGLQLQGAFGRAGIYTGSRVVGFDAADGQVGAFGAQWGWAPGWTGAASALATEGRIVPDGFGEATLADGRTRALHAATAWMGARDTAQLNLLASSADGAHAFGAWLDANARRGRYAHSYGVFRLGSGLAWGARPINNDVEGAYYRLGYQYGRWNWNLGLDQIGSVSGDGFDGQYATGFARYQTSTTLGLGGSLSVRRAPALSHSAQLFLDRRTRFGQTRLQLDQADSGGDARSWQFGVDHAFALREGARLSTSIAYGALRRVGDGDGDGGGRGHTTTLALSGGRDLGDALALDANVRWLNAGGVNAQRGLDLNLTASWRIAPRWSLEAALYQSQGSQRSPFVLDPLVTETPFISLPRERSVFLTLRYQRETGRPYAVIGGAPGAATGSVTGRLFLDDNDDGVRAASELPAVNVTVVLDGRYSVRTDSAGRFEFARVAVGTHRLDVVSDNLPLPWAFDETAAAQQIEVRVREATRIDLGAHRPR